MRDDMPTCEDCKVLMVEMAEGLILCPKCGVGLADSFQSIIDYMNPGVGGLQYFDLDEIGNYEPDKKDMKFLESLKCPFELHLATACEVEGPVVGYGYDSEEVKLGLW
jgi:hypothetical protein